MLLLIQYMESSEERRDLAKYRALVDALLGCLEALLIFGNNCNASVTIPSTGWRYLRTSKWCPLQCGRNYFPVEKLGQCDNFMTIPSLESVAMLVYSALHSYVHYNSAHDARSVAALKL